MNLSTSLAGLKEILFFDNRFELIFHHLFRSDEQLSVYRFRNFQVVVLKAGGDLNGIRACVATDQYKQFFPALHVDKPLTVLDLGAHTGGFIFSLLASGYQIETSLSVEQNQQTYVRLAFNFQLNSLQPMCKSLHAAVWSGQTTVMASSGEGQTSGQVAVAATAQSHGADCRSVKAYSLNDLILQLAKSDIIDICKLDIEGAEWEIFAHPQNCSLLWQRCRYLIIEIHPSSNHDMDLVELITDNNFELVSKCRHGDETFLFKNMQLSQ